MRTVEEAIEIYGCQSEVARLFEVLSRNEETKRKLDIIKEMPVNLYHHLVRGGHYSRRDKQIFINDALSPESAKPVFLHELAHAIVDFFYRPRAAVLGKKIRSHGIEWKRTMYALGQNPTTCVDDAGRDEMLQANIHHYKFLFECRDCGKQFAYQRYPRRIMSLYAQNNLWHTSCRHKENKGLFNMSDTV